MTAKSKSALTALWADNTSQDISEADLRDGLDTFLGLHGAMYVKDGSTAQSSIGTSFVKVTGFASDDANSSGVTPDSTTDDDLTVTVDGMYLVIANVSFTGTASTKFTFALAKNGTATDWQGSMTLNATPDSASVSIFGFISCSASDTITLQVKGDGASKSITPVDMALGAKMIG